MNGNLLDTHTFIWYVSGDSSLSSIVKEAIEKKPHNNFLSVASLWEIAIKVSLQKLDLNRPFAEIEKQIASNGFQLLPILFTDTFELTTLPFLHKDPFDRIIIAQAMTNNLQILTKDQHFGTYPIKTLW